MDEWVSLREFARRQGVNLKAVQKAISSGRIQRDALRQDARGRNVAIEVGLAKAQYAANTDPLEAARNGKFHEAPPAPAVAGGDGDTSREAGARAGDDAGLPVHPGHPPGADVATAGSAAGPGTVGAETDLLSPAAASEEPGTYQQARTLKEQYAAKSAQVAYLQTIGKLVEAAAVQREVTEILVQLKTGIMRVPERMAQILAAETDPARVHRILSGELRSVLDECSRHFADDAAGGAEESATAGS